MQVTNYVVGGFLGIALFIKSLFVNITSKHAQLVGGALCTGRMQCTRHQCWRDIMGWHYHDGAFHSMVECRLSHVGPSFGNIW